MEMMCLGTRELLLMWCAASLVVLVSMFADLCAGLYKAKIRGDKRTSYALKRSVYKFLTYEGAILIGGCIDLLIHFAHLFSLVGLDTLDSVPVIALLIGIFLCAVELMSIREKADAKTHETMKKVEDAATKVSDKLLDNFVEALVERMKNKSE